MIFRALFCGIHSFFTFTAGLIAFFILSLNQPAVKHYFRPSPACFVDQHKDIKSNRKLRIFLKIENGH